MSSDLQPPSSRIAERLAVIVDAAERAALKVIDDAEKEANRYLEEARARADRIAADRLREEADRLESGGGDLPEPRLRPVEHQLEIDEDAPTPGDEPEDEDGDEREVPSIAAVVPPRAAGQSGGGSAAARLLATQMAVSGSTRVEIEMRLRNGFEIEDTSEILDAILGPEG
jgi:hypothetical protein